MNALLVDDERLARQELRRLLASHADVTIVGEAVNADEAVARLADPSIDLVFLDIQMPGGSGFDVLERLDRVPLVVFTTAFDEYAVRAFEVNAFDYLMKPIRTDRLTAVLEKARAALTPGRPERPGPSSERVFLRDGERCWIVPWADIALFEVEGNYARAHFGGNRPLIRVSLNSLEARLDPALFFRASRQHIVNLRFIESVETAPDDSYIVLLNSKAAIRCRGDSRDSCARTWDCDVSRLKTRRYERDVAGKTGEAGLQTRRFRPPTFLPPQPASGPCRRRTAG